MKVYLNSITGIDDAILSMYFSNGKWNEEIDKEIRETCYMVLTAKGERTGIAGLEDGIKDFSEPCFEKYDEMLSKLLKIGRKHITLLRFIDISVTVDGLHRAGQDDWDSHAKRFDNRIIRMSTRRKMVPEMSDYYREKAIPFGDMPVLPDKIIDSGKEYIKVSGGYVRKGYENDPDVLRGLFPLGMASSFIFKCNLTEFSHVYKERRKEGYAHPEVKELCEKICDLLEEAQPMFTRELLEEIKN